MRMNRLGLKEMIEHIESSIINGEEDIAINTEFGRLVVEVDHDNYGPETNVVIDDWSFAPASTKLNYSISGFKADYYVCICNPVSTLSLHLKVVEAVYRIMFKHILSIDVDEAIVDAAIMIHRHDIENKSLTVNSLVNDFTKNVMSRFIRNNDMVQWLVRDHFERKLSDAKLIIEAGCELFDKEYSILWQNFIHPDEYNRKMFGLILYVSKAEGINLYNETKFLERKVSYIIQN